MERRSKAEEAAVQLVIVFLGFFCLVGLFGLLVLVWSGRELPEGLVAIVGTAVGGLGAILARTQTAEGDRRNIRTTDSSHETGKHPDDSMVAQTQSDARRTKD